MRQAPEPTPIQVKHLPDNTNTHIFLYCDDCRSRYSAVKSDYFPYSATHVLRCCDRNLRAVTERTELEDIEL